MRLSQMARGWHFANPSIFPGITPWGTARPLKRALTTFPPDATSNAAKDQEIFRCVDAVWPGSPVRNAIEAVTTPRTHGALTPWVFGYFSSSRRHLRNGEPRLLGELHAVDLEGVLSEPLDDRKRLQHRDI